MTELAKKIITAAREYRIFGWNVIPLCNYSKSPSSSPFIRQKGWKDFEERTLTEEEFIAAFNVQNLTGVGLITGAISRTVVIDEDSYKEGGMTVAFQSPMVSQTGSGGRHIFGKYSEPLKNLGFRKGVNVEGKADGGFVVLPPSQVYKKDRDGKLTKEIGEYKWLKQCEWEALPIISKREFAQFKREDTRARVVLENFLRAPLGEQHTSIRTIAMSIFNRFPPEEWHIAEKFVRDEAAKFDPPHPEWRVNRMIEDAKSYIRSHPKDDFLTVKRRENAKKTGYKLYSEMSDEELDAVEDRETITSGLPSLDEIITFRTGFYVICANPGAGKGWFSTFLAKQFFIIHQKRSVLFSLEMGESLVRARLFQQWSVLTEEQMEGGNIAPAKNLMKQDAILIYPFGHDDTAYQTPENFIDDVIAFYEQGYRVFHFDHLHELEGANDNTRNQRVIEEWGKAFQTLCKDLPDIWLFVFAQPNGAAIKKAVLGRGDISGSKSITQKCEVFLSLNRSLLPEYKNTNEVHIDQQDRSVLVWVDKNRLSSQQKVGKMIYLSRTGNFTELQDSDVMPDVYVKPALAKEQQDFLDENKDREVN